MRESNERHTDAGHDSGPRTAAAPDPVADALARLRANKTVVLPGTESAGFRAFRSSLRALLRAGLVHVGVGAVLVLAGIVALVADEVLVGGWRALPLLALLGSVVMLIGALVSGIAVIHRAVASERRPAEYEPVVLDRTAFGMRGIGPIWWFEVEPPRTEYVRARNDVSGLLEILPLSRWGVERINSWPWRLRRDVGPLHTFERVSRLAVLPGIVGFTSDEVMRLFGAARALAEADALRASVDGAGE